MIRLAALALLAAQPGEAAACRLGLALGLDISSSVDAGEYEIQRGGLVAALRDGEVRDALLGQDGEVRIAVYEWSGYAQQDLLTDWTALTSPADIDGLAARIAAHERPYAEFSTAIGKAVEFGAALMARLPTPCDRLVIDLSGDGENNEGPGPHALRRSGLLDGVVINGLVIRGADLDPVAYYRTQVISGPGAFLMIAEGGFADFPAAIRRKLLREARPDIVAGAGR